MSVSSDTTRNVKQEASAGPHCKRPGSCFLVSENVVFMPNQLTPISDMVPGVRGREHPVKDIITLYTRNMKQTDILVVWMYSVSL